MHTVCRFNFFCSNAIGSIIDIYGEMGGNGNIEWRKMIGKAEAYSYIQHSY